MIHKMSQTCQFPEKFMPVKLIPNGQDIQYPACFLENKCMVRGLQAHSNLQWQ